MIGFLRRVLVLVALVAFGWAGWRYVQEEGLMGAEPAADSEIAPRSAPASPPPPAVEAGAASDAIVRPDSVRPQSAPRRRERSDELDNTLREGHIAYNRPETMRLNRPTNVRLELDPNGNEDLRELLDGYVGEVVERTIPIDNQVGARLTGADFDISGGLPMRQVLAEDGTNSWSWSVRPLNEGRSELVLEIFAYSGDAARPIRTYRDPIVVQVSNFDQVMSFAASAHPIIGLIAGTVSLLLAMFGLARRRRERRERDGR